MRYLAQHRTQHRRSGFFASLGVAVLVALAALTWRNWGDAPDGAVYAQGTNYALRLYGSGVDARGLDRVSIPIDAPARPADLGATDFTIEFWLKATPGENTGAASCGANDGWITANTLIDRDIFGGGDYGDFGIAVSGDVMAFGVSVGASGTTLCSTRAVVDGHWHHVAAVRRLSGAMQLFIDGQPAGSTQGAVGDASYRDGRSTSNPADPYLVFGAEKHDAGAAYPSFSGWLDEVRLSTTARYTVAFTPPTAAFVTDSFTAGLYHFDEGPAGACTGAVLDAAGASGGPSNGVCAYGGAPAGPVYVTDTPFIVAPPTATDTSAPPTATDTSAPPTNTPAPPTSTPIATTSPTLASSPTSATTPGGTIPPIETSTPVGQGTPTLLPPTATPTLPPCLATPTPAPTSDEMLPINGDWRLYLPLIQQEPPCASTTL